jgi:hypothetical protein
VTERDLVTALQALTDKQFVELFYQAVQGRHLYSAERNLWDAHLVLANAVRDRSDGVVGPWSVELVCLSASQHWADGFFCEAGEHCGMATTSCTKHFICPVCGGAGYGT